MMMVLAKGEYTVTELYDGDKGDTGRGITSITEEYAISTSKTTAPDDADFSTTQPTWTAGSYIWTRSKIVYNNPTSTDYTTPVVSSEWEAINELDITGRNLVLNSRETQVTWQQYKDYTWEEVMV